MVFCFCNDTVFELNAGNNVSDQFGTPQKLPALLGALRQFNTIDKNLPARRNRVS